MECEETKNASKGVYDNRKNSPSRSNNNVNQTNNDVKTVHLYNIKEMKGNKIYKQDSENSEGYRGYFQPDKVENKNDDGGFYFQEDAGEKNLLMTHAMKSSKLDDVLETERRVDFSLPNLLMLKLFKILCVCKNK